MRYTGIVFSAKNFRDLVIMFVFIEFQGHAPNAPVRLLNRPMMPAILMDVMPL